MCGLKRSKPDHNQEGRSEAEIKRQSRQDLVPCHKFKKRHRKELNAREIEEIVAAAKQPFQYHKDVAQRFKITKELVGRLVKESRQQPEKHEGKIKLEIKIKD